jgi:rhodanese-related sulfurtransferase
MAKTQFDPGKADSKLVSREEITVRLKDPCLVLVNVLPKETFALGHIPRSINLPLAQIESRASELLPDRDQEIAIYCNGPT